MARKVAAAVVVRRCRDCALSTPDMRFENLSLEGEPTLLSCPHRRWKMVICTTDVCEHYTERGAAVAKEETKPVENKNTDGWFDW